MAELTSGINQLIERIKGEGVAKAESERSRILEEASAKAESIIASAEAEADALLDTARTQADMLAKQAQSELRLAIRDFIADFAERMRSQVITPAAVEKVEETLNRPELLGEILKQIIADYAAEKGGTIEAVVSPEMKEQLDAIFVDTLGERLTLRAERGLAGFRLRRENEGFSWDFTLEAIVSELMRLVEPTLRPFFSLDPGDGTSDAKA